jgi:hypothetical protein
MQLSVRIVSGESGSLVFGATQDADVEIKFYGKKNEFKKKSTIKFN